MGSRVSKAVGRHAKTAVTPVATALPYRQGEGESEGANESTCQIQAYPDQWNHNSNNNISAAASTTTPAIPQRRDSAPVTPATAAATADTETNIFVEFLAAYQEADAVFADSNPAAMASPSHILSTRENPALAEREVQCLACCKTLPKETDPRYAREVLQPCRECPSEYCTACVRSMFVDACKDLSRMPPRCCVQIHLHHARPFMQPEEVAHFKVRFEEWSTSNPWYCPVPLCSTFIPDRLLPLRPGLEAKRPDSGVSTPTASLEIFPCPSCATKICVGCRQVAHPGSTCVVTKFGVDAEMSALLKKWGYKQCPKCGQGLKRMFGCNHMECRCGAQFCWGCLKARDLCYGGGCYEAADEVDEESTLQNQSLTNVLSHSDDEEVEGGASLQYPDTDDSREGNLDSGSDEYWEEQDFDFGEEPNDDVPDRSWKCKHTKFLTYEITLATALSTYPSSADMECTKCWTTIYPDIMPPRSSQAAIKTSKTTTAGRRERHHAHVIFRPSRRATRRDTQLRGLYVNGETVGTAPHLTTTIISPSSQLMLQRGQYSMEDVEYTPSPILSMPEFEQQQRQRRLSVTSAPLPATNNKAATSAFFNSPSPSLNLAHECVRCGLLVCEACKAVCLAAAAAAAAAADYEGE